MAGVVRSDLDSKRKIDFELLEKGILGKQKDMSSDVKEAVSLASEGAALCLNRSIGNQYIYSLLETGHIFKENFSQINNLHLNLESYSFIGDDALIKLAETCRGIKKINLKSCISISDKSVEAIAKNCRQLEEIDLSWCDVSEKSLFFLGDYSKKLKRVSVRSCYITDTSVLYLLTNCPDLRILGFAWCKSLTDLTLEAIERKCPKAEILDIRGNERITSNGLCKLFQNATNFTAVHLKRCLGVDDNVLQSLCNLESHLKHLNLRGCYKSDSIKNQSIIKLFSTCNAIETLDIAWHNYINDDAIIALANHCRGLQKLDISGCNLVSDSSLRYLAEKCSQLKTLVLFQSKISSATLEIFRQKEITVKQY
jgi:F-box/leucine-rich repeat protein 2/20